MIEHTGDTDINKGCDRRAKAGNGTARPECHPDAPETAPPSSNTPRHTCQTCEYLFKLVHHPGAERRQHRAEPPAPYHNPHSA
jgi:hypothetical protein